MDSEQSQLWLFQTIIPFIYKRQHSFPRTLQKRDYPAVFNEGKIFVADLEDAHTTVLEFELMTDEIVFRNPRQIATIEINQFPIIQLFQSFQNKLFVKIFPKLFGKEQEIIANFIIPTGEWIRFQLAFSSDNVLIVQNGNLIFEHACSNKLISIGKKCVFIFGGHQKHSNKEDHLEAYLFKGALQKGRIYFSSNSVPACQDEEKKEIEVKGENLHFFLHTLYELYAFEESYYPHMKPAVPLKKRKEINPNKPKALICHDICSGFGEDHQIHGNFSNPFGYRYQCWSCIDYFIYFSHHFVTIPPPGYINAAHRAGVKMLGTFIVEWEEGAKVLDLFLQDQVKVGEKIEILPKYYFCDKLIQIAKYYGFEGYLLNIECKVESSKIPSLLDRITYLSKKIKEQIPDALMIWYDSVTIDGDLRWQSMLNEKNKQMFDCVDAFFTDYHWQLPHLQKTMAMSGNRSKEVFIGNDIYGRGTYAGGMLNTYKALDAILKYPLSVAIFGQAYYYEHDDGFQDREIFNQNEKVFWHGNSYLKIGDQFGTYKSEEKKDFALANWSAQGDWELADDDTYGFSTVSSFKWCQKSVKYFIPQIVSDFKISYNELNKFIFQVYVKGTPPKSEDEYRIFITAFNMNDQPLGTFYPDDKEGIRFATPEWELIKITINLKPLLKLGLYSIQIMEAGKDVEYWAGHYGTRFAKENMKITLFDPASKLGKALSKRLQHRRIPSILPFGTFFSEGMGKQYFLNGKKCSPPNFKYNNLNEYDVVNSYILENRYLTSKYLERVCKALNISQEGITINEDAEISIQDATSFNGTSSLLLSCRFAKLNELAIFKLFKTNYEVTLDLSTTITMSSSSVMGKDFSFGILFQLKDHSFVKCDLSLVETKTVREKWITFTTPISELQELFLEDEGTDLSIRAIYFYLKPLNLSRMTLEISIGHFGLFNFSMHLLQESIEKIKIVDCTPTLHFSSKGLCSDIEKYKDIECFWKIADPEFESIIHSYRIFIEGEWVGTTLGKSFIVHDYNFKDKSSVQMKIQALTLSNEFIPLDKIEPFQLECN